MDEDRAAITALVHAYAELLDAGEFDALAQLFEHSTFGAAERTERLRGTAEVRRVFDDITRYEDGTPRTKHVISNLTVELAGDTATSRCYFTVLQAAPDGPLVAILAGRYHDRFERVDGQWRFVDRLIHPDLFGDLGGHMRQGAGSSPDP
ncbi:MAG: nuclear transport factor 2 family protein [Actinobacteria bacterium]|nr:MAG: nuclear transport factor 2 family protein [Actinomycetota bacterium]